MRHFLLSAAVLPALFAFATLSVATPAGAATSPESKACSDQATAKGLHGADREAFRATCLKSSSPAASAKAEKSAPAAKVVPAAKMGPAPAVAPAAAKSASGTSAVSKACSDQATAKGLHGADREKFRNACLKGAPAPMAAAAKPAPVAAAKPEPVAAATKPAVAAAPAVATAAPPEPGTTAAKTAKPAAAPGTRSPAQLAADQRIHACGQQWQAAKAAGKIPAGQTWPKYWSACSARMKTA